MHDLTLDMMADLVCMTLVSSFAALLFSAVDRPGSPPWMYAVVVVLLIGGVGFFGIGLVRRWTRRTDLRLGLDGEMATGEELNQLMLRGCRVFHDVPADGFNIDHVVVGPAGVFAAETKARAKPARDVGPRGATVRYDGNALHFPGWHETQPLEQARRQAEWLRKWLTSAVGEPVAIWAVLALPGWFVERTAPGDVLVINPKNATFLSEPREDALTAQTVQRIAHQLEQRCRNVAPLAFRDPRPAG